MTSPQTFSQKYLFVDDNDVLNDIHFKSDFFSLSPFFRFQCLMSDTDDGFEEEKPPIIGIVVKQQPKSVLCSPFLSLFCVCTCSTIFRFYLLFAHHFHLSRTLDNFFFYLLPSNSSQQAFPILIASLPRALFRQSFPLIDK